jgi:hypothetical protein
LKNLRRGRAAVILIPALRQCVNVASTFKMTPPSILCILTFALLLDTGCGVDKTNLKVETNDTTQILRHVIDSAFYHQRLPDFGSLTRNNPLGDTIIFKFDSILIGHLPIDLKYKFLTQDEICSLATKYDTDTTKFCNFLELDYFKKVDTTYEVILKNECVRPLYDKSGKPKFDKDFYKDRGNYKCMFGMLCGGGMSMTFIKQADTINAKINGFHSD